MSREIQFAFTAADLAMADAGLTPGEASGQQCDPNRLGVVFGSDMIYCELDEVIEAYRACMPEGRFDFSRWASQAMPQMYPLWLLKYLPNMPACHVAIANDARGPCNAHTLGDASSLSAVAEGFRLIERGAADCVIVGGTGFRLHPTCLTFRSNQWYSAWQGPPEQASRPFEKSRSGQVPGEGAGAFILEAEDHARARGASIMARVLAAASRCEPVHNEQPAKGSAIRASIAVALEQAQLAPGDVGHVNAHGFGTVPHDRAEAQAIRAVLGDVPVTAPKSYFGNLGAGSGAVEMAASVLALQHGKVPATLNYDQADPECPIRVVSAQEPARAPTALVLNQATTGQALAVVLAGA
jgi:3-oxoacyl-[acyl-carrier-protein] synthase II